MQRLEISVGDDCDSLAYVAVGGRQYCLSLLACNRAPETIGRVA